MAWALPVWYARNTRLGTAAMKTLLAAFVAVALGVPALADPLDDACREGQRRGQSPEQLVSSLMPLPAMRHTEEEMQHAAFSAASFVALVQWCSIKLSYCEQVEGILVGAQVSERLVKEALDTLKERRSSFGLADFCRKLEEAR